MYGTKVSYDMMEDMDGNGIPDMMEDKNGNGILDGIEQDVLGKKNPKKQKKSSKTTTKPRARSYPSSKTIYNAK